MKLQKLKDKLIEDFYLWLLIGSINGMILYRFSERISLSIEIAILTATSSMALQHFFGLFWKTYKRFKD
tara:strand:- start:508 stop:714 length:207 start_codon:yes stop_codon:yes gene_type:complete